MSNDFFITFSCIVENLFVTYRKRLTLNKFEFDKVSNAFLTRFLYRSCSFIIIYFVFHNGFQNVCLPIHVARIGMYIAGCYVLDGKVTRQSLVRVVRDGIVVFDRKPEPLGEGEDYNNRIGSLQRFKDSVKEVAANYECGMSIEKYNDIKEGDIFECFIMEEVKR